VEADSGNGYAPGWGMLLMMMMMMIVHGTPLTRSHMTMTTIH